MLNDSYNFTLQTEKDNKVSDEATHRLRVDTSSGMWLMFHIYRSNVGNWGMMWTNVD